MLPHFEAIWRSRFWKTMFLITCFKALLRLCCACAPRRGALRACLKELEQDRATAARQPDGQTNRHVSSETMNIVEYRWISINVEVQVVWFDFEPTQVPHTLHVLNCLLDLASVIRMTLTDITVTLKHMKVKILSPTLCNFGNNCISLAGPPKHHPIHGTIFDGLSWDSSPQRSKRRALLPAILKAWPNFAELYPLANTRHVGFVVTMAITRFISVHLVSSRFSLIWLIWLISICFISVLIVRSVLCFASSVLCQFVSLCASPYVDPYVDLVRRILDNGFLPVMRKSWHVTWPWAQLSHRALQRPKARHKRIQTVRQTLQNQQNRRANFKGTTHTSCDWKYWKRHKRHRVHGTSWHIMAIPTLLKMEFEGGESYWNFILKFHFCNHVFSMINIPHHSMSLASRWKLNTCA